MRTEQRRYQTNIAHCAAAEVQKTSPFVMAPTGKLVSKTIRAERIRLERKTPKIMYWAVLCVTIDSKYKYFVEC